MYLPTEDQESNHLSSARDCAKNINQLRLRDAERLKIKISFQYKTPTKGRLVDTDTVAATRDRIIRYGNDGIKSKIDGNDGYIEKRLMPTVGKCLAN